VEYINPQNGVTITVQNPDATSSETSTSEGRNCQY